MLFKKYRIQRRRRQHHLYQKWGQDGEILFFCLVKHHHGPVGDKSQSQGHSLKWGDLVKRGLITYIIKWKIGFFRDKEMILV